MMIKSIAATLLLCAAACGVMAQPYKTEIKAERGESWWGLFPEGIFPQPFPEDFTISLSGDPESGGIVHMLLSNNGRYVWSSSPFGVEFDGETFIITSQTEQITIEKAGRTLREAYLVCAHKNFRPGGTTPDPSLFSMPVYDTSYELRHAMGDNEVVAYAEKLLEEGFPAGIIVIGDGWRSQNNGYVFDKELWPDPQATIDRLHGMGFKVMLTISCEVPALGRNFINAANDRMLIRELTDNDSDVALYGTNFMGVPIGMYSMDDPRQFAVVNMGYNDIKSRYSFDGYRFGKCEVSPFGSYENRTSAMKKWSSAAETSAMSEVVDDRSLKQFANYVTTMPVGGDKMPGTDYIVTGFTSAGLLGLPYLRGMISPTLTEELAGNDASGAAYLVLQAALPIMGIDFAPWRIKNKALRDAVMDAFEFRKSIAEYMETLVKESGTTAEPIVRHMAYQFPRQGFADCDDQFMRFAVPYSTSRCRYG